MTTLDIGAAYLGIILFGLVGIALLRNNLAGCDQRVLLLRPTRTQESIRIDKCASTGFGDPRLWAFQDSA